MCEERGGMYVTKCASRRAKYHYLERSLGRHRYRATARGERTHTTLRYLRCTRRIKTCARRARRLRHEKTLTALRYARSAKTAAEETAHHLFPTSAAATPPHRLPAPPAASLKKNWEGSQAVGSAMPSTTFYLPQRTFDTQPAWAHPGRWAAHSLITQDISAFYTTRAPRPRHRGTTAAGSAAGRRSRHPTACAYPHYYPTTHTALHTLTRAGRLRYTERNGRRLPHLAHTHCAYRRPPHKTRSVLPYYNCHTYHYSTAPAPHSTIPYHPQFLPTTSALRVASSYLPHTTATTARYVFYTFCPFFVATFCGLGRFTLLARSLVTDTVVRTWPGYDQLGWIL